MAAEAWLSRETVGHPLHTYGDPVLDTFDLDFYDGGQRRRIA
ncbi:hypothetical protein AB0N06_33360 [Streptomyces sp. NPDC051020]